MLVWLSATPEPSKFILTQTLVSFVTRLISPIRESESEHWHNHKLVVIQSQYQSEVEEQGIRLIVPELTVELVKIGPLWSTREAWGIIFRYSIRAVFRRLKAKSESCKLLGVEILWVTLTLDLSRGESDEELRRQAGADNSICEAEVQSFMEMEQ